MMEEREKAANSPQTASFYDDDYPNSAWYDVDGHRLLTRTPFMRRFSAPIIDAGVLRSYVTVIVAMGYLAAVLVNFCTPPLTLMRVVGYVAASIALLRWVGDFEPSTPLPVRYLIVNLGVGTLECVLFAFYTVQIDRAIQGRKSYAMFADMLMRTGIMSRGVYVMLSRVAPELLGYGDMPHLAYYLGFELYNIFWRLCEIVSFSYIEETFSSCSLSNLVSSMFFVFYGTREFFRGMLKRNTRFYTDDSGVVQVKRKFPRCLLRLLLCLIVFPVLNFQSRWTLLPDRFWPCMTALLIVYGVITPLCVYFDRSGQQVMMSALSGANSCLYTMMFMEGVTYVIVHLANMSDKQLAAIVRLYRRWLAYHNY